MSNNSDFNGFNLRFEYGRVFMQYWIGLLVHKWKLKKTLENDQRYRYIKPPRIMVYLHLSIYGPDWKKVELS